VTPLGAAALASVLGWLYLLLGRSAFWRADQRLEVILPPAYGIWPAVVVVIPARDEAPYVGAAVASLLRQDYPGSLRIVLVDDGSTDGTAEAARTVAREAGAGDRLTLVESAPLPPGWTGKMWSVAQGVARARELAPDATYLLLTDADVVHQSGNLGRLVGKAEANQLDLVSLMVRLHCVGAAERLLIPAFVFFFQKLYPFPAVNDRRARTAAAAGGCMLVRAEALARAGGIEAVKGELIDDCALARRLKPAGGIWLGLSGRTRSIRPYDGLAGIWRMVARTAFTQLRHSLPLLALSVVGMVLVYLVPPLAVARGLWTADWPALALGLLAWALMARAYAPTLALYGQPWPRGLLLPAAAVFYLLMTLESAWRHLRGQGGGWKGRTYPRP